MDAFRHGKQFQLGFILAICWFFSTPTASQSLAARPKPDQAKIAGEERKGYSVLLDYPAKEVEKGWWAFARTFGRPINMRGYYRTIITDEHTSEVVLLSQSIAMGKNTRFFLTVQEVEIPAAVIKKYQNQVQQLLVDFKKHYYTTRINDELKKNLKAASQAGKKADKSRGAARTRLLDELTALQQERARLEALLLEVGQL